MNIDSPQPNVQDLQQDVISLLDEIEDLMRRASKLLGSDASVQRYIEFQQRIRSERKKVESLELVMAIVAPMKAGKSTIVNAIVGQELMPSRASAMTTLPTEITLSSDETEPTLTIYQDTCSHLQKALSTLQGIIKEQGIEQINLKIARYPHLQDLIPEIQDGLPIELETYGLDNIKRILTILNDVIRICSILDPLSNPLIRENLNLPCIATPFWQATDVHQSKLLGNLVIIDTPGPNEAGEKLRLSLAVEKQLRRSSMVLVVLDFTQLNNQAAEEIKKQIKPIIDLIGKENLYVLVNKVDQRTEKDPMTGEKVKQFVVADLELGADDENRIFEVAARRAFCAANFLAELQHNPNLEKEELRTARALAEQVWGIEWEEELEDSSLDKLQNKAQKLWRKSGFEPFLENAINVLMASAAPQCIRSALNLSQRSLEELKDNVLLRGSAIAQDEQKLRFELEALEEDINHLDNCRKRLKEIDSIKSKLKRELGDLLEDLKQSAKIDLESFFSDKRHDNHPENEKTSEDLLSGLRDILQQFLEKNRFTEDVELEKSESKNSEMFIEFSDKEEAKGFSNQAILYAQDKAEKILRETKKDVDKEVRKARKELRVFLEEETNPIIERAQSRLKQSFDVSLSLPSPNLDISDDFSDAQLHVQSKSKWVSQEDEIYTDYERVWWHWLYIIPTKVTKRRARPDKRINYYVVSLEDLIVEINSLLEKSVDAIEANLNEYIGHDLQKRMDIYFNSLDTYLSKYRDSLRQAQADQKLAVEDKKKLINGLNLLAPQAIQKITKCREYIRRAKTLISREQEN